MAVYGIDGTALRVADSDENREYFGLASGAHRGDSGYPMVQVATLMSVRSHLLANAVFAPYTTGEKTLAAELWDEIPDHSLTVVDRGLAYPGMLLPLHAKGKERNWLVRVPAQLKSWEVLKRLGPKDVLVRIGVSRQARRKDPTLPESYVCRALAYSYDGHPSGWMLTSLLDRKAYPKKELVALYHERWELELGYDEIKTTMLRQEESLRSQTVDGTRQELWGIFLAYNLVRLEMAVIADELRIPATQISFALTLRFLLLEWRAFGHASPGSLPKRLSRMREDLIAFALPKRRPKRRYPRAVKRKMSSYAKKRRSTPSQARGGPK